MTKNLKRKTTATSLLTISCIGMVLSGCTAEEKPMEGQTIENIVSSPEPAAKDTITDVPTVNEPVEIEPTEIEPAENKSDINESDKNGPSKKTESQTATANTPEPAADTQSLYEQFLNNRITVTVGNDYPEDVYSIPILEKGSSYTLAELKEYISQYYLNPEYTTKTTCDYMQYAYIKCPDSMNGQAENLLLKLVGLNIYSDNDDSYAVFVITEDNGRLYITGGYECWARSTTTEYVSGTLISAGSNGAEDHQAELSVILSNGKITAIYRAEFLSGYRISSVNSSAYYEIFGDDAEPDQTISIYTIGDEKYYQYYIDEYSEEEKSKYMNYIDRCREEQGIHWVTDEELESAVKNQCGSLGIDYGVTQQQEEVVWNNL